MLLFFFVCLFVYNLSESYSLIRLMKSMDVSGSAKDSTSFKSRRKEDERLGDSEESLNLEHFRLTRASTDVAPDFGFKCSINLIVSLNVHCNFVFTLSRITIYNSDSLEKTIKYVLMHYSRSQ